MPTSTEPGNGGAPTPARVLIAPDCFGDSLTAAQAAQAIAAGWRQARPHDTLVLAPQSDGGPGFVDVLAVGLAGARRRQSRVSGPLADDVDAEWLYDDDTATAYLECAQACGLSLIGGPPDVVTAVEAHSRGVGQLIGAALSAGARSVVVGLGGSACTDGGRGMVEALGGLAEARRRTSGVRLIAATDVEHPLLGPRGAARVFGPQKGASPAVVRQLEQRLTEWAGHLGPGIASQPGAGAAGGLGAALLALGAHRESGAAVIAQHTGLARAMAVSDLIVTGEGRLDDQSPQGKVVGTLARDARQAGVPVLVLAGQVTLREVTESGISAAFSLADYAGSVELAMVDAERQLTGLAARAAAAWARE